MIANTTNTTSYLATANTTQSATVQTQANSSNASPAVTSGSDTVQLSTTAQATALHQQGLSVKAIATDMGLTTAQVDSYLGITTSISSGGGVPASVHSGTAPAAHSAPVSKAATANGSTSPATKTTQSS